MWLVCNCICCAISGIGIGILYMVSWRRRKLLWLSFSGCFTGSSIAYNLKVLTKFFFFRIQFFIPNWCPKYVLWFFLLKSKTLKNDSKIFSALSPTIARSRLFPLIGFPQWLPLSQRNSSVITPSLALVTVAHWSSQQFYRASTIHNVK